MTTRRADTVSRRAFLLHAGCAACLGACAISAAAAPGPAGLARPYSCCGLYCHACRIYLDGRAAKKPTNAACTGCNSATPRKGATDCAVRACCRKHGVDICALCREYPCERIRAFHANGKPYRALAARNLDRIKAGGLPAWMKEQETRWRCPACRTPFAWNDETCATCKADLTSCADELKAAAGGPT